VKAAEHALGRGFDVIVPEDRKLMFAAINQGVELSALRRGSKIEKAIGELAQLLVPQSTMEAAKGRRR
jgi:pilus assembly protein CpaE